MLVTQTMQNFRARKSQILQQVASVRGQAAAMRVHITDRDLVRYPRIEHRERGIENTKFGVPGDFAFAD